MLLSSLIEVHVILLEIMHIQSNNCHYQCLYKFEFHCLFDEQGFQSQIQFDLMLLFSSSLVLSSCSLVVFRTFKVLKGGLIRVLIKALQLTAIERRLK